MRLKTEERFNLPLLVKAPILEGSRMVGLKGVNLLDNEKADVYLTTTGKAAENENRPSIEDLFNGSETEGGEQPLQSGGIVSMNGALKKSEGVYIAQWPFVIRLDETDTAFLCQHGTLISSQQSAAADFYSFHPEQTIVAAQAGKTLKQAVAKVAAHTTRPAYLIRVVQGEQLLDYELYQHVYDTDQKRALSAEEIAVGVTERAKELLDQYPGKKLDILPATRLFIPADNMEKRHRYFNGLKQYFEKPLDDGDREYCCRKALVKTGGDKEQYCNQISVIEPFKPGLDPVLIGGYSYPEKKNDSETENQMAACRP